MEKDGVVCCIQTLFHLYSHGWVVHGVTSTNCDVPCVCVCVCVCVRTHACIWVVHVREGVICYSHPLLRSKQMRQWEISYANGSDNSSLLIDCVVACSSPHHLVQMHGNHLYIL